MHSTNSYTMESRGLTPPSWQSWTRRELWFHMELITQGAWAEIQRCAETPAYHDRWRGGILCHGYRKPGWYPLCSQPKQPEQPQKEETPTDGEFLSGFWRTDRLIPVITLVIYFGSEAWDAPLSLKEMYSSTNNAVLAHAPNYHVNLLNKIPNINIWKDKLRKLLMLLRDPSYSSAFTSFSFPFYDKSKVVFIRPPLIAHKTP